MATKTKVVGFNAAKMKRDMMKVMATEQTRRLVEYAQTKVLEIGERINSYASGHHMDDNGNLLDSLCWGVTYKGKLEASGFYREQQASQETYLHAFWQNVPGKDDIGELYPIYGHGRAQNFIEGYNGNGINGWTVFFAILADYWGYWEKGFRMKVKSGPQGNDWDEDDVAHYSVRTMKFSVMTEFYDKVKQDLKPSKVRLHVYVPTYNTNRQNNLRKKAEKYANNNSWREKHDKAYPTVPFGTGKRPRKRK